MPNLTQAREDLIAHLAPLLQGAFQLDSRAQALAGARALVDRLVYVVDEHDDLETTSLGSADTTALRQRWIVIKVPNGVEHLTLPRDRIHTCAEKRGAIVDSDADTERCDCR